MTLITIIKPTWRFHLRYVILIVEVGSISIKFSETELKSLGLNGLKDCKGSMVDQKK